MSSVLVRALEESDLQEALALCRVNGWNQVRRDWKRLLAYQPDGCFAAEVAGRLVGTVTTTCYGRQLGWIGMMLVHPDFRRRQIATTLLRKSIDFMTDRGIPSIKLDATPVGRHVYTQLGFQVEWVFQRWVRAGLAQEAFARVSSEPSPITPHLLALDRSAFGVERRAFLDVLAKDSAILTSRHAFGMLRPGMLASYLGPVTAETISEAEPIIVKLCEQVAGTIFWDVPSPNESAVRLARKLGFEATRELTRMWLGRPLTPTRPDLQYAIAGPATG